MDRAIVPVEPTDAMLAAACEVGPDTNSGCFNNDDARRVWAAMIEASNAPLWTRVKA